MSAQHTEDLAGIVVMMNVAPVRTSQLVTACVTVCLGLEHVQLGICEPVLESLLNTKLFVAIAEIVLAAIIRSCY